MKLIPTVAVALVVAVLSSVAPAAAAEDKATTQPAATPILCPVTGQPVDWNIVERFRHRWVYFATEAARDKFTEDPFEYADGIAAQWEANHPLRLQVTCPVTGKPVDRDVYVGTGLDAVYFADEAAKRKWAENPDKHRQKLTEECYTYQTRCAHSGQLIDPAVNLKIDERVVYFFCPMCRNGFQKESKAHQAELLKQVDEQITRNKAAWKLRAAQRKQP